MARSFLQVDVFASDRYRGNALAVVLDGTGLDVDAMQRFTDWTNLSEATFLLPSTRPGADYRVRIFCPGRELPFAGHPTLGSCHAWLESGGKPRADDIIVQECEVGLVRIRRDGDRLAFAAPPLVRSGAMPDATVESLVAGLGIRRDQVKAHAWCDNGPQWQALLLDSADTVLGLRPDPARLAGEFVGVVGPLRAGSETAFEVRAFFPGQSGLTEDPVTGSLNAALGQWLIPAGFAPTRYVASQGTVLGRAGRVHVERDAQGDTWIGGRSLTCIAGSVEL
jgi:PhzF family phenazine biosynthesis protein